MRKEKLDLLKKYINELRTIKYEINKNLTNGFITSVPYLYTLNNGMTIPREKLFKNGCDGSAVIIAPYIKETDEFLVVIEPRVFTKNGIGVSFPAGYIDKGETPYKAALRELREETGYVSNNLLKLDSFYQDEGISSAFNHSFLALNCKKKYNQDLDPNEIIRYMLLSLDELDFLETKGMINGANTKLTLAKIKRIMK